MTLTSQGQTTSPSSTGDVLAEELSLFKSDEQLELMTSDEFAYLATKGQEFALKKDFRRSNDYFEQAYFLRLDRRESCFGRGEEWYDEIHEVVVLLYLKMLNYLQMGSMEDALVECKRLDEWIHPQKDNDVQRKLEWNDPLVHMLMALLYDSDKDYDDAWIDYHHAAGIYNSHYKNLFGKHPPRHLTLRSLGLDPAFQWMDNLARPDHGALIVYWNNGRSPVERVETCDFKIRNSRNGWQTNDSTVRCFKGITGDTLLSLFSFSRPFFTSCKLERNGEEESCDLIEDLTWFSVRKTSERLRQPGTHVWRKGRSWSTMPGSIYYAVVPLIEGDNNFTFTMSGNGATRQETFSVPGDGRPHVYTITTLESIPVPQHMTDNLFSPKGVMLYGSAAGEHAFALPSSSSKGHSNNSFFGHKK